MADDGRAIHRVFTRGVVGGLLRNGTNAVFDCVVHRYIDEPENKTYGALFSEIYAHLGQEQRNEYYYMNTLLNKLLAGIHSVATTTALSKVRVGRAVADFIVINGEEKIYALEVKSELDNFDRLYDQVSSYYKAFRKVSILVSVRALKRVERVLSGFGAMGEGVGIHVLSDRDTIFSKVHGREPKPFDDCLDHSCIFNLLRKREYENVLLAYGGHIPQVAPVFYYRACLAQFGQIPILTAQALAFQELKKRNKITKTAFERIPPELKSVVYFSDLTKKLPDIEQLLQTTYRG
ncbi:MAG: sce7726 family protein [Oscillospiraceae bacterium]|nr:sce7726 family protein [Oscillospiraceae bacterium]